MNTESSDGRRHLGSEDDRRCSKARLCQKEATWEEGRIKSLNGITSI